MCCALCASDDGIQLKSEWIETEVNFFFIRLGVGFFCSRSCFNFVEDVDGQGLCQRCSFAAKSDFTDCARSQRIVMDVFLEAETTTHLFWNRNEGIGSVHT